MTYRFVPQGWLRALQLVTLAVSVIAGTSVILLASGNDPKLSVIERTMSGAPWGVGLVVFGALGLLAELWMWWRSTDRLVPLVSYCHIALCGVLAGLSTAALLGVVERQPANFIAPVLGVYLAFIHLVFVKRRPRP